VSAFLLAESREILERTPRVLDAWLRGMPEAWASVTEGEGSWSAFDVVGHLIHGEETDWIPRARLILEEGEARVFPPFDRTAMFAASRGRSLDALLTRFAELRAESLRTLDGWNLNEAMLERRGRHPAFGAVTLRQLLATWTAHDLGHLAQVARVMAKRYRDEVGPWREYLSVMEWKA
jgi:hypothetical protein